MQQHENIIMMNKTRSDDSNVIGQQQERKKFNFFGRNNANSTGISERGTSERLALTDDASTGNNNSDTFSSTHSPAASSAYTASIIQSAAKSVLDNYDPPAVSDDEEGENKKREANKDNKGDNNNHDHNHDNFENFMGGDLINNENFVQNDDNCLINLDEDMKTTGDQMYSPNAGYDANMFSELSPDLESLCVEMIPAMPEEQDRKRFVGCLAAILAVAYDYDVPDQDDHTEENRAKSVAYLQRKEQFGDDENAGDNASFGADAASSLGDGNGSLGDGDAPYDIQDDDGDEVFGDFHDHQTFNNSTAASDQMHRQNLLEQYYQQHYQNHNQKQSQLEMSNVNHQQPQQLQQQQDQMATQPSLTPSGTTTSEYPEKSLLFFDEIHDPNKNQNLDISQKNMNFGIENTATIATGQQTETKSLESVTVTKTVDLLSDVLEGQQTTNGQGEQSKPEQEPQSKPEQPKQQQQQQQQRQKTGARIRKDVKLSRDRHRKRRYDILSSFLLSSAQLLFLDKSHARAFLPMLARVLLPSSDRQNKNQNNEDDSSSGVSPSPNKPAPLDSTNTNNNDITKDIKSDFKCFLPTELDHDDVLRPFLEALSPGAGFRCLALLLIQHLLHSKEGYDSRIRHIFKKLGVIVLIRDMERDPIDGFGLELCNEQGANYQEWVERATRKFESLEHNIATRLIRLSKQDIDKTDNQSQNGFKKKGGREVNQPPRKLARDKIMRGIKVGSVGIVAGTLFAVTGGLAAPGIMAGVAAIAGGTVAATAATVILSSTAAVTAIFGVSGGTLAAYKMNRRTQGLTEFRFIKERNNMHSKKYKPDESSKKRQEEESLELFSTICISGWLNDINDFQRPWGVIPKFADPVELLERFYFIYKPEYISRSRAILKRWKGEERGLWRMLHQTYGRDPHTIFPLANGPRTRGSLTLEQEETLDVLFSHLGYYDPFNNTTTATFSGSSKTATAASKLEMMKNRWMGETKHDSHKNNVSQKTDRSHGNVDNAKNPQVDLLNDPLHGPGKQSYSFDSPEFEKRLAKSSDFEKGIASSSHSSGASSLGKGTSGGLEEDKQNQQAEDELPKHLATVWDYRSSFGGELYTVVWESNMLIELCDSVTDMAFDMVSGATINVLRTTALSTLLSAVALPYALVNAASTIDSIWTIAVERSEEAGKELAKSLLFSKAGNRPMTLVGYSFGARVIYSCLKELVRYQERWESAQELKKSNKNKTPSSSQRRFLNRNKNKTSGGDNNKNDNNNQKSKNNGSSLFHDESNMREPASIIEDVIIMGLPNHLNLLTWRACRQIVSGRLVNCYSKKDLILTLMFQIKRITGGLRPVCGACPVDVPGVENIDVTDLVSSHQDYCLVTGDILKRVRHGQPFTGQSLIIDENQELLSISASAANTTAN